MESPNDVATLRERAEHFVRQLLRQTPPSDLPSRIVDLAADLQTNPNPLGDLFLACHGSTLAQPNQHVAVAAAEGASVSHRSKFSFRFGRSKGKVKVEPDTGDERPATAADTYAAGHSSSQAKTSTAPGHPYRCVLCPPNLAQVYTTKGTCKRHLEDHHVAKQFYRCTFCQQHLKTAPEARKHCSTCGLGAIGYTPHRPEPRRIYSSEFHEHATFTTQQHYVAHLLDLCAAPPEDVPVRSWTRKLRNLIELPIYEATVRELSVRLFGSPDGWRTARWEHERIRKAVAELENGLWPMTEDGNAIVQAERTAIFMEALFADRAVDTSSLGSSLHPRPMHTHAPLVKAETQQMEREDTAASGRHGTPGIKRPLSTGSAAVTPNRHPPGPPVPDTYAHQQQSTTSPLVHTPITMQHATPFETAHMESEMGLWPSAPPPPLPQMQSHHPPPYDGNYDQAVFNSNESRPQALHLPAHTFDPFGSDYLALADLSVASTVASPDDYVPNDMDQGMSLFPPGPQAYSQNSHQTNLGTFQMPSIEMLHYNNTTMPTHHAPAQHPFANPAAPPNVHRPSGPPQHDASHAYPHDNGGYGQYQ